jgi:hypothetical protein
MNKHEVGEATWETNEVHLWIANDEPSYNAMKRCKSPKALARMFYRAIPGVRAWSRVDWKQIFEWFEEDRS